MISDSTLSPIAAQQTEELTFLTPLPPEVTAKIFSYVSLPQCVSVVTVSHEWYATILAHKKARILNPLENTISLICDFLKEQGQEQVAKNILAMTQERVLRAISLTQLKDCKKIIIIYTSSSIKTELTIPKELSPLTSKIFKEIAITIKRNLLLEAGSEPPISSTLKDFNLNNFANDAMNESLFTLAENILRHMSDSDLRMDTLYRLTLRRSEQGKFKISHFFRKCLHNTQEANYKTLALQSIAREQAKRGLFEDAWNTAWGISDYDQEYRNGILLDIKNLEEASINSPK